MRRYKKLMMDNTHWNAQQHRTNQLRKKMKNYSADITDNIKYNVLWCKTMFSHHGLIAQELTLN